MSDHQPKNDPALPTAAAPKTDQPTAQAKPKPAPKAKPKPKDKKPKPKAKLQPLQSCSGTLGAFGANPDGIYDRFTLETAGQTRTVKFPPHFGQALQALAQPGQPLTVLGFLQTTPQGAEHLHLARVDAAGASARPLPPPPAPAPSPADDATVAGTIAALRHDPKGRLHGLRLADEAAELRLPPHLAEQLAERLVLGAAVAASGRRHAPRPGEVAAPTAGPAPVQVELLTLGADSFLLR